MSKMLFKVLVLSLLLNSAYSANFGISRYHEEVGIPLAKRLRDHEQNVLRTGRIAGGDYTDISEIPHQAGIIIELLPSFLSFCGGTLISSTRVLTAAHCYIEGASNLVTLGSNFVFYGGIRANVTKFILHPGYSPADETFKDDLALLHITPVVFSDLVQPVALPSPEDISNNFAGYWGRVSGYGVTPDNGPYPSNLHGRSHLAGGLVGEIWVAYCCCASKSVFYMERIGFVGI